MKYRFTRHAFEKISLMKKYGFSVNQEKIILTIEKPVKKETKGWNFIATSILDKTHVLRVVYRQEDDIIIIITIYPGRIKSYLWNTLTTDNQMF